MTTRAEILTSHLRRPGKTKEAAAPVALADQAYEIVKADIVLGRLAPGVEVTEVRLGERYGFGRAPVRAALSKLVQEGLLNVVPRRGYVISPITIKSVQEIFQLRLVCEPKAVHAAVGRVNVQRLRAFNSYPHAGDSARQNLKFLRNNRDFHSEIIAACGNQRLIRVLCGIYDEMDRLLHAGLFMEQDRSVMQVNHTNQGHQHDEIIAAIEAGDAAAAEEATVKHIESSRDLALHAILGGNVSFSI